MKKPAVREVLWAEVCKTLKVTSCLFALGHIVAVKTIGYTSLTPLFRLQHTNMTVCGFLLLFF